jgi:uroporphyrinogen-III decarboxylase
MQTQREETAEGAILRQRLSTPYGPLTQESRTDNNTSAHWQTEYLFKEIEHLHWALAVPYMRTSPCVDEIKEAEKRLGDDGLLMVDLPTPISSLHSYASPADLACWIATDIDVLTHYLDVVVQRQLDWLTQALEAGAGPVFFVTGTEFVAPPLASPAAFARLATRYNGPLFELIHRYGGHIIVHHHGRARQVLAQIVDAGADGVQPIEEPPVGDLPLAAAKELMRERCTIVGSVQYDDLSRLDDDAFEALIRRQIRDAAPEGRFILAPTAGPYETEITLQHARNLRRMIDLAHELGTYPLRDDI